MNPQQLVARWHVRVAIVIAAMTALMGIAAGGATLWVAASLGASAGQGPALAGVVAVVSMIGAWRRRGGLHLSSERVALWLEECSPDLSYRLLGALGQGDGARWASATIAPAKVNALAWRRVRRSSGVPLAAAAVGVALGAWAPPAPSLRTIKQLVRPEERTAGPGSVAVTITAPRYAKQPVQRLADPDVVRPLSGSRLVVSGSGSLPEAQLATQPATAVTDGNGWRITLLADTIATVLRITRNGGQRLMVIDPVRDAPPVVAMERPDADTVTRVAPVRVVLAGTATDDLGLATVRFEYIVSSGDGERFTFRTGTLGAAAPATRDYRWSATLALESLALVPGDVLHLRAVATDRNVVTGPGIGTSDSRSIRVARAAEYDSVAVDAAPPPDMGAPVISQRMLINLTEALVRRERILAPPNVRAEAARIGRDQARLRRQVSDLVFARLGDDPSGEHFHGDGHEHGQETAVGRPLTPEEMLQAADRATGARGAMIDATHDETPVVAVSRPLLEAYNAMWAAGRALESGAPREALPPMYIALAAIQKARAAERLYLRGASRPVVVDLAKVRLSGKERGATVTLADPLARPDPQPSTLRRVLAALGAADAGTAVDSLLLLRVGVADQPAIADALDALVAALRVGRDVTPEALQVRRVLGGQGVVRSLGAWSVVP